MPTIAPSYGLLDRWASSAPSLVEGIRRRRISEGVKKSLPINFDPSSLVNPLPIGPSVAGIVRLFKGPKISRDLRYDQVRELGQKLGIKLHGKLRIYGRDELRAAGKGAPGLSFEDSGYLKKIVYRSPSGKPVAVASVLPNYLNSGKPKVLSLAADHSKGLLYGRAVYRVGKVLQEMDALEPTTGGISIETLNLMSRAGLLDKARRAIAPSVPEVVDVGKRSIR
jgi:hypothetical protein